ncbi:MAG: hypothetical protein GY711_10575 [bacterium]|nr:hypothetical protein [bacterium]
MSSLFFRVLLTLLVLAHASGAQEVEPQVDDDMPYPADIDPVTTESGLQYSVLRKSENGDRVRIGDRVRVHFTLWTPDGLQIDGSRDPAYVGAPIEPREFGIGDPDRPLMRGMLEALQLMEVGDHYKLNVPYHLAYGERGSAKLQVPPKTNLIFEVEIAEIASRTLEYEKWTRGGAKETESGLRYRKLETGEGLACAEAGLVYVDYALWSVDGQLINSSGIKGRPFVTTPEELPLPFLKEAMQQMRQGDRWLFHVPSELAFGDRPMRALPPGSSSVWQLSVRQAWTFDEPAFELPPSHELEDTASGLKFRVVRPGTGYAPAETSTVRLHHVGWRTDGTRFDSSYHRKKESTFSLAHMIPGWREALLSMREGGEILLVVPPELAYGEKGFKPYKIPADATLVYRLELIEVR